MANEASELLDGTATGESAETFFSDENLDVDADFETGDTYTPEDYKAEQSDKPIQEKIGLLKEKGLERYKDIPAALDGLIELNSQIGSMGSKLEGYGQLQERNKILEEQLEKLFEINEEGNLVFSENAVANYVRKKEIEEPEKTHDEILEELDDDFGGTLDKLIEKKVGGKIKSLEAYIAKQQRAEQSKMEQTVQDDAADDLFSHYMENEEGFAENIQQIDEILDANPELYDLSDPLKIAMQMLKRAENIAAKRRADGTFVESSRTQKTEKKSEDDILFDEIYAQQSNAANLLSG